MILYEYECKNGHVFDAFSSMEKRKSHKCPECKVTAKQRITPSHLDYLGMGTSPSLPTAADKWARMHEKEGERQYK
jgi:putative FmdB family regulatory protein